MDEFKREDLRELIDNGSWPSVSIYMPMSRVEDVRQNHIRFKNLVRKSQKGLAEYEYKDAEKFLEKAYKVVEDQSFWIDRSDGLAMFISRDLFKLYRLTHSFEELFVIGERFHLKPMISVASSNSRFYLLAAGQNEVRLFQCTRDNVEKIESEDMPKSAEDTFKYDDPRRQLQFHNVVAPTAGGSTPKYHGQGVGIDDSKENMYRFARHIDKGLSAALTETDAPLVFAGAEDLFAIFKEVTDYKNLFDARITGNSEHARPEDLKNKALSLLEPLFKEEENKAAGKFMNLKGTGMASADLESIAPAAYFGRVDTLFVPVGIRKWGIYDPERNAVELHKDKQPRDQDLLDFCAMHTLVNSGRVFAVKPSEIPDNGVAAAVFRY